MTSVLWPLRKTWHPRRRRLARLRAWYWIIVRRHETEICGRCGGPVNLVFHVSDELWLAASGFPEAPHGVLCPACFVDLARDAGFRTPFWECAEGEFPSCVDSPCVHQASYLVVCAQRDELWMRLQARDAEPVA